MTEPIRILHVDDDPAFVELTATFLERECDRFVVDSATDADAGLDRLAGADIDCVVSDSLARGRGRELLAHRGEGRRAARVGGVGDDPRGSESAPATPPESVSE
jgi:CheY-like chemotaxis protein